MGVTPGTSTLPAQARPPGRSRWFYPALSGAILAIVFLGFAPSFYLRSLFPARPIPGYLYVHGAVLTAWFVLVLAQTCLVAARRVDLHRRLGVATAAVAVLVVLISPFVAVRAIPRYLAAGVEPAEIRFIVIGDLVCLALFSALVTAALKLRRQPDWHRRLMLVACVTIVGPAVGRLSRVGLPVPVPPVLLMLLAVLAADDWLTLRRLHRATAWGSLAFVIALAGVLLVVDTALGRAIVEALR